MRYWLKALFESMKFIFCIVLLCNLSFLSYGQELLCNVKINLSRVQTQETQIYNQLQKAIEEFMNTTEWTDDTFQPEERIQCSILLTFTSGSSVNQMEAEVQIQSERPVYNTDYKTTGLTFFDGSWQFTYNTSQPLIFTENAYSTELTALLAYFAYIIIGFDYDSFSSRAGEPYYQKAMNILNFSQQSSLNTGWRDQGDTRARYWLAYYLTNLQFENFRKGMYQYYRIGIDHLSQDPDKARKHMLEGLQSVEKAFRLNPLSLLITLWIRSKQEEIVKTFFDARPQVKTQVLSLVKTIDPSRYSIYKRGLRQ